MKIKTKLLGLAKLKATLLNWGNKATPALASALYEEGEKIKTKSLKLVPVDTGALRSTALVSPPFIEGGKVSVAISYGGPAKQSGGKKKGKKKAPAEVGYAIKVHEDLTAYHKVGQAKYLEVPLKEAESTLVRDVAKRARRKMRTK